MKKINLCIDIDSTVTKPDYWVDYFNKHFNTNYKYSDDTVEEYLKNNNVNYKIFDEFYHKYAEEMHKTAEIRPDAFENIKKLEEFCTISYVTARESHIEPITIEWLKKHKVYNDTYHLGSFDKTGKARDLDCDIFIEDNIETSDETEVIVWQLMTTANVQIQPGGIELSKNGETLQVENLSHPDFDFSVVSLDPPPFELDRQMEGLKRIELRIPAWIVKGRKETIKVRLAGN